ncbi:MAG: hypothetical protein FWD40_00335 [Treponema sp.]|nr:hypothetical protein [Treponema sp.]
MNNISNIIEYILNLIKNKEEYIIIICAKDNIGKNLDNECADLLLELGVKNDLSAYRGLENKTHRGFIAIIDGSENIIEYLSDEKKEAEYINEKYNILSTVYANNQCKPAYVYICGDNINCIPDKRGLNFLILNKYNNEIIDGVVFDTHLQGAPFVCRININEIKKIKEIKDKYNDFCKYYIPKVIPELKLLKPEYPFGEIALITGVSKDNYKNFANKNELYLLELPMFFKNNGCIISNINLIKDRNDISFIFSGNAIYKENFIFGIDDIKQDINIESICECIGEFEILIINKDNIKLGNDFFGLGKWFYYKKNNIFIAATSYHLLLMLLSEINEEMDVNVEYIIANAGIQSWITQQLFSEELEIKDIFILSPDKKIEVDINGNIKLINTRLYFESNSTEGFDEKEYEELLYKAKNEIIQNINAIYKHKRFKNIIVDLTDGLDTRNILSAVLNLPLNLIDKTRIHSYDKETSKNDFKTACGIVNMLNLKWDNIKNNIQIIEQTDGIDQSIISSNLGIYYLINHKPSIKKYTKKDTIHLNGGNGETCTAFINKNTLIFDNYIKNINGNFPNSADNKKVNEVFIKIIYDEFKKINSEKSLIIMDMFYQKFRNRIHFSNKYDLRNGFSPIQSISAYKAKKMSFKKNELSFALQHDLIKILHPLLAGFPYIEKKQKNRIKVIKENKLNHIPDINMEFIPDYNLKNYEKNIKKHYIPDKNTYDNKLYEYKYKIELYDWLYESQESLLSFLKIIIENVPEFEKFGFEWYEFIINMNDKKYDNYRHTRTIIKNKIISLYYQIRIIKKIKN